jgi:hypothetical protein
MLAFESQAIALHHFLLCLILTVASSSYYYLGLHQGARKAYRQVIPNVQEIGTATKFFPPNGLFIRFVLEDKYFLLSTLNSPLHLVHRVD